MEEKSQLQIGPLIPFFCEYKKPDGLYAIILYGMTESQILEDNCDKLEGLKVLGIAHEAIPVKDEDI